MSYFETHVKAGHVSWKHVNPLFPELRFTTFGLEAWPLTDLRDFVPLVQKIDKIFESTYKHKLVIVHLISSICDMIKFS